MDNKHYYIVWGKKDGERLESRLLEETVQRLVSHGHRNINVKAYGQHGIGGRLWRAGNKQVHVKIDGPSGQRVGSMGFPNTFIEVMGPASDDLGWLNGGAEIVVHGHAANGVANAMAQGRIYVAGSIGARGMTMTKHNPRFDPPELWVLGSAGDYFGEFMAGGIAVICGVGAQDPDNVLGYRPLVGMVGGKVFFRGPHQGFSQVDAKPAPIGDTDWNWLLSHLQVFLARIGRAELLDELSDRKAWQLLVARTPQEKSGRGLKSMAAFHRDVWDRELGRGGMIGDLSLLDRSPVPLVTTGDLRRFVPVWENRKYAAPCQGTCPTGMPVQERWRLVREGRIDEAVDLALAYTPFPATVCGYLCPNLCMEGCTRQSAGMLPVDVTALGQASLAARLPELPPLSGRRIAVVGGGPAGISVAWQLRRAGHEVVVFDRAKSLGGKIVTAIPQSRIPAEVVGRELERVKAVVPHEALAKPLSPAAFEKLKKEFDYVVVAVGAQKPVMPPLPGAKRAVSALDFLARAKTGEIKPGKRVVIIGAGNVGCDVATEAHRLGAESITLLDIQEPASFGKEREAAEAAGAVFRWPCHTKEITKEGVLLASGELLPADTVAIAVGDRPDLDFLPPGIDQERGFVKVNPFFQTSDPRIFAVGDVVKPGLLTDAIGAGRRAAAAIAQLLLGKEPEVETRTIIPTQRVSLEYFDPRVTGFDTLEGCGDSCASCGACRDCGICVAICPQGAIRKVETAAGFEYQVDDQRCIGCGFCAGACPCGIWNLVENAPLD